MGGHFFLVFLLFRVYFDEKRIRAGSAIFFPRSGHRSKRNWKIRYIRHREIYIYIRLSRSRFVSRATIERNRALELSLRFARHPSRIGLFFSFFPFEKFAGVFLFSYTSCSCTKYRMYARITDYHYL